MSIFRFVGLALATVFLFSFLAYRLTEVPPGLTVDEAAFGYNGVLLAETGRDETGKFLPVFALSIEGKDWRQPVTQYFIAGFFKVLGADYFKLRLTSVLVTLVSLLLLFYFVHKRLGSLQATFTSLIFLTTPVILIHSHMALDNIMPVPFVILWLLFIFFWEKKKRAEYLVFSAIALGIGFYTYKAMRAIVPVWALLTVLYLSRDVLFNRSKFSLKKAFRRSLPFIAGISPFALIIPYLQRQYPGAIFGGATLSFDSFYSFFYPYLSNLDLSFLFIKGDLTVFHSTGKHGMFLLSSLPLFAFGIYQALKKGGIWRFVAAAFFWARFFLGLWARFIGLAGF